MKENNQQLVKKSSAYIYIHIYYIIILLLPLLLLSFSLGYLSAPSSSNSSFPNYSYSNSYYPPPHGFMQTDSVLDHYLFSTRCAANPVPPQLFRQTILHRVFNGTSPYLNFPPPHIAPLLQPRPKRIKGWGSNGSVFDTLIRRVRPNTIIEVGTFLGASAVHMVGLTRRLGLHTQILCLDDFRGWPGFQHHHSRQLRDIRMINGDVLLLYQFMHNVAQFNATGSILFLPFSTTYGLDKLCEWGILGDLIEIDAGHDFHSAWSDINRAYKLLRSGGVIFGHDYFTSADNRGVRRAINLFARIHGLQVKVDGQHWIIDST